MRFNRNLSFGLFGLIVIVLAAGSIIDRQSGHRFAVRFVYASPWMVALWTLAMATGVCYIVRRIRHMCVAVVSLHAAFIVILAGAALTHFSGVQGRLMLSRGEPAMAFRSDDLGDVSLPFAVTLSDCRVENYPGTSTPMDYVSQLSIDCDGAVHHCCVSVNKVLSFMGYRFCQTGMGEDSSVLTVSHDGWGMGVTYAGYLLLLGSVIMFFFSDRTGFRHLLSRWRAVGLFLIISVSASASDAVAPPALQRGLARDFGRMSVMYNGRVCAMQTLARDFCKKICGSYTYKGLTAEQVLTGWIFYYNDWKREPMITVSGERLKSVLGCEDGKASLADFYRGGRYLPATLEDAASDKKVIDANEKVGIISAVCSGSAIKIFPCVSGGGVEWFSWVDDRPAEMSMEDWKFIRGSMEYFAREIAHGRNLSADSVLTRIIERQVMVTDGRFGPDTLSFKAELIYNRIGETLWAALLSFVSGLVGFFIYCRGVIVRKKYGHILRYSLLIICWLLWSYVAVLIALRAIVGGQVPLGNGHETMLLLAWITLSVGIVFTCRIPILQPASLIIAALALLVAMMGQSSPQVSYLMPVLQSPLLCVHVLLVMLAYSLLMFMAMNSIAAFFMGIGSEASDRLAVLSRIMLYPAVFLLAAGIFTGAVWAAQSWGRYWDWDPKETWALITFLIYSLPIHSASFHCFNKSRVVHIYFLGAIICVLITYFGVNLLLPGMHSYA